jgi:hypothetical protein
MATAQDPARTAARRGPGRPPSRPTPPPLDRHGIVSAPIDAANRFELMFHNPASFKQLFNYFKNIKAGQIHVRCTAAGVTFFARDHSGFSRVVAFMAGAQMNWYYCERTIWFGLNRENVEKVFTDIDGSYYKFTIVQARDDHTTITFALRDYSIDKEVSHQVTVSELETDPALYEAEAALSDEALRTSYPVAFTLSAKQFKKTVADAINFSDTLTIEKIGLHPLQFTYSSPSVQTSEVYQSSEKIDLVSTIAPGAHYSITMKIGNIKPLSSSMVTDDIRVMCPLEDDNKDILFRSAIVDRALVVSTLTRLT